METKQHQLIELRKILKDKTQDYKTREQARRSIIKLLGDESGN